MHANIPPASICSTAASGASYQHAACSTGMQPHADMRSTRRRKITRMSLGIIVPCCAHAGVYTQAHIRTFHTAPPITAATARTCRQCLVQAHMIMSKH